MPATAADAGPLTRLDDPRPGVRRTAILDLAALGPGVERDRRLLARLAIEDDPRARILVIRALGDHRYRPARPVLWRLYADRATPVEVAHAAVLAHDRVEAAAEGAA